MTAASRVLSPIMKTKRPAEPPCDRKAIRARPASPWRPATRKPKRETITLTGGSQPRTRLGVGLPTMPGVDEARAQDPANGLPSIGTQAGVLSMRARSQDGGSNERNDDYRNPDYLEWRQLLIEPRDTEHRSHHRLGVG